MTRKHLQMTIEPTQSMVDESIYFLREHEPEEGYFLGFSGGKDSIVSYHLCKMAGVKFTPYYSATGIDPPEVIKFIRENYSDVIWLRPKYSFWEGVYKNAPPLNMQRWCCDVLKKNPSKKIKLKNRLMGIRSEESVARSQRPRIDLYQKKIITYKPIFHWKEFNIWEFIDGDNIKYPCLYDEGFDRIGCVICPFITSKNRLQIDRNMNRWPTFYKAFEHAVERWFNRKIKKGHVYVQKTAKEYIDAWYRGFN